MDFSVQLYRRRSTHPFLLLKMLFQQAEELTACERDAGLLALLFELKAQFQLPHRVIRPELPPGMVVHGSEFLPQFWKKGVEFPQFTERLQGAAPAGHTPENIIQTAPIKSSLLAVAQAVGFGHAPIYQGIAVFPHPTGFVGGNAYILDDVVFLL